jgi:uncharacterized membrane protein (Fun14 family)
MTSEALLSSIIPFAGSGLLGYAMGFALKKVLKWMLIIVGFLAGMFLVGVQLLQKYGYVSAVIWDKLNDTSTQIQHWASNVDMTNVHGLFHTLGIPVTGEAAHTATRCIYRFDHCRSSRDCSYSNQSLECNLHQTPSPLLQ